MNAIADGVKGNADLVAYFFLRAGQIASRIGLLATDSIAQGDTRQVGLDRFLVKGWTITRAFKSLTWPGGASLEIAKVWLQRPAWSGLILLDGDVVIGINALLEAVGEVEGNPERLRQPFFAFQGSNLAHAGYVLSVDEAAELLAESPRNSAVVRPYVSARDLNERPDHAASRFVIDFGDMPLSSAESYPSVLDLLRRRVLSDIERKKASYPGWIDRWWQCWNNRAASYKALESLERVIGIARVSNTLQPAFLPTGSTYDVQIVIFASDSDEAFGILSSSLHWWWVFRYGSKRGVGGAPRYTPTDCFETLPLPDVSDDLAEASRSLSQSRRDVMAQRGEGLTKIYNRVHNASDESSDVVQLRDLHINLDYTVAKSYGWTGVNFDHDFYATRLGQRFTISPGSRTAALDRLLVLNHDRHGLEPASGGRGARATSRSKRRGAGPATPGSLF